MLKNSPEFKRKLEYLSKYRGCKESEIIFRRFAEKYLADLSVDELEDYHKLLERTDAELMDWLLYNKQAPEEVLNNRVYKLVHRSLKA